VCAIPTDTILPLVRKIRVSSPGNGVCSRESFADRPKRSVLFVFGRKDELRTIVTRLKNVGNRAR